MTAKSSYSKLLLDPRWQKKRLEILNRDDFTCQSCFDNEDTLHVHHCFYKKGQDPWDYPDTSLITLCKDCHSCETEALYGDKQYLLQSLSIKGCLASDYNELACAIYESPIKRFDEYLISAIAWSIKSRDGLDCLLEGFASHIQIQAERRRKENAKS